MKTELKDVIHPDTSINGKLVLNGGLTKREYFSAMAMQGYLSCYAGTGTNPNIETVTKRAVEYADALIKELENNI